MKTSLRIVVGIIIGVITGFIVLVFASVPMIAGAERDYLIITIAVFGVLGGITAQNLPKLYKKK
jgi:hypothetical protein